jgi:hypothetical protein
MVPALRIAERDRREAILPDMDIFLRLTGSRNGSLKIS